MLVLTWFAKLDCTHVKADLAPDVGCCVIWNINDYELKNNKLLKALLCMPFSVIKFAVVITNQNYHFERVENLIGNESLFIISNVPISYNIFKLRP